MSKKNGPPDTIQRNTVFANHMIAHRRTYAKISLRNMVRNWQMIVFLCRLYSIVVTHNICMCTHIRRPQAYLGRKGIFINLVTP